MFFFKLIKKSQEQDLAIDPASLHPRQRPQWPHFQDIPPRPRNILKKY